MTSQVASGNEPTCVLGWEDPLQEGTAICSIILYQLSHQGSPAPLFLPGKSHGWRSLTGYSSWGLKEWDATEAT